MDNPVITDELLPNPEIVEETSERESKHSFPKRIVSLLHSVNQSAQRRKLGLIWIILVIISSLSWTAYNVLNFQTSVEINKVATAEKVGLENEIAQLLDRWQTTNQLKVEADLKTARNRIFNDYQGLADWLYLLTQKAKEQGIELTYQFGQEAEVGSLTDLIAIPLNITASIKNESDSYSIYFELIGFIKELLLETKHQELFEAGIENKGENQASLSLLLKVWMWKPISFDSEFSPITHQGDSIEEAVQP